MAVGNLPSRASGWPSATRDGCVTGVYRKASATPTLDATGHYPRPDADACNHGHGHGNRRYDMFRSQRNGIDLCVGLQQCAAPMAHAGCERTARADPAGNVNVATRWP